MDFSPRFSPNACSSAAYGSLVLFTTITACLTKRLASNMLKRLVIAIEARFRNFRERFQIIRAEDVRSLLLGHCTLSYFDLQPIFGTENCAEAPVQTDPPIVNGSCKVCGELQLLSYWDSVVGGACEECSGFLEEAEKVLLENELGFPPDTLVVQNP